MISNCCTNFIRIVPLNCNCMMVRAYYCLFHHPTPNYYPIKQPNQNTCVWPCHYVAHLKTPISCCELPLWIDLVLFSSPVEGKTTSPPKHDPKTLSRLASICGQWVMRQRRTPEQPESSPQRRRSTGPGPIAIFPV